ncbi:hypothetical protein FOL47_001825 [Perkinsus chesapeaki]|uniref:Uncharacterized protein n=1 Tax=Perkinsus chesapeaki TaxID=330153 RepID=A0A7J6MGW1_PERCH|nr:hypothetical protein FOL47_001825 [Perkinsus chesapeaki]
MTKSVSILNAAVLAQILFCGGGGPIKEYDPTTEEVIYEWAPVLGYDAAPLLGASVPGEDQMYSALETVSSSAAAACSQGSISASSSQGGVSTSGRSQASTAQSSNPAPASTAQKVIENMRMRRREERTALLSTHISAIPPPCDVIPDEVESSLDSFRTAAQRIR